jgi:hypothetical protein
LTRQSTQSTTSESRIRSSESPQQSTTKNTGPRPSALKKYHELDKGRRRKKKKKRRTYLPTFFEIVLGIFGLLMQRNGQKLDKKKSMGNDDRKKVFFSTFSAKSF